MIDTRYRALLARETEHLAAVDRHQVQRMTGTALALINAHPAAYPEALADKLLTLFPGSERWVRVLVAKAALEAVGGTPRTQLAA